MEEPVISPKRISAVHLKQREILAVRDWPRGCGPPSDEYQPPDPQSTANNPPDNQPVETAAVSNGFEDLRELNNSEGQNWNSVGNEGLSGNKRWMKIRSNFYPPPKRRGIYAIRTFPPGCGPDMEENDETTEIGRDNQENMTEKAEVCDEIVSPDQNDVNWVNDDVKPTGENEDLKGKEVILHEEQEHVITFEIGDPIVVKNGELKGEGSSKKKKKKKCVRSSESGKSKSDEFLMREKEEEFEEIDRSVDQMQSEPSKEIVLFDESNQEMYKTEELKKKKKKRIAAKKTTVSRKKKSSEKSMEKFDNTDPNLPLATIPYEEHNSEENNTELHDFAITPFAESPKYAAHKPAKKSIAGPSKSLKKNINKRAKKSTKPLKELNPNPKATRFKGISYELNLPPINNKSTDPRGKVRRTLCIFQMLCRKKLQEEESKSKEKDESDPDRDPQSQSQSRSKKKKKVNNKKKKDNMRVDLKAGEEFKASSEYSEPGKPIVGSVPGIEVGDEFRYRMELHLVGLHRPLQCGIDWTELPNGIRVATSIVSSGGYSDKFNDSGVLIYTGSGGKPNKKRKQSQAEDQKLEKGNLALKNSMELKMPVRVIHGSNVGDGRKVVMTFTYDGLYLVESFEYVDEIFRVSNDENKVKVFKFRLRRLEGQPKLGLHMAAKTKEARVREGLCTPDISDGKENMPICAINTIDDEKPPKFKYITSIIYPSWYEKTPPQGCDCNGKCSNLKNAKRCTCALKNGGNLPFNSQCLIIETKDLVFECGPTCKCPPSCPNRVSQNGITIPLEIFKTESRGWGVRSLSSISSGSFICEYVGELLEDEEAEKLEKEDEYLFDIGKNYDDATETDGGKEEEEGFTIDAGKMGNVGRFINHSCSPNLYAQNILFDHGDKRMPHVMFFAAKNIPPLQELTYYYNYRIGEVRDMYGNEKRKDCYCGSVECEGRLY